MPRLALLLTETLHTQDSGYCVHPAILQAALQPILPATAAAACTVRSIAACALRSQEEQTALTLHLMQSGTAVGLTGRARLHAHDIQHGKELPGTSQSSQQAASQQQPAGSSFLYVGEMQAQEPAGRATGVQTPAPGVLSITMMNGCGSRGAAHAACLGLAALQHAASIAMKQVSAVGYEVLLSDRDVLKHDSVVEQHAIDQDCSVFDDNHLGHSE